jgi:hypothetical protein
MKTIEIDIDHTASPKALVDEFRTLDLQRGDHLRLLSSKVDEADLLKSAVVMMVVLAINLFLDKERAEYADNLLKDIFEDKNLKRMKEEIKRIYDIDFVIDVKEDEDQQSWRQFGKSKFAKAYGDMEPEYDMSMVKEANPNYKK